MVRMLWSLLALVAGLAAAEPRPFVADYRMLRGSLHIADARFTLVAEPQGGWTLTSVSEPVGVFRLLTDDVIVETSRFALQGGALLPSSYVYEQRNSKKDRNERYQFDHAAGRVSGVSRGEAVALEVPAGTIDPLLLRLAVGIALGEQRLPAAYSVVERHKLRSYELARTPTETIKVPAGSYAVEGVSRVSEDGKKTTRFLYSAASGWLPVVMEHVERDEPTIRLELTRLARDPAAAAASGGAR
jgi:hypothetical protein